MGVTFKTETISGVDVSTGGEHDRPTWRVFQDGDHVILTLTPTADELPDAWPRRLIDANK